MDDSTPLPEALACRVYRATRRADTYLFVPEDEDTDRVPEGLRAITGRLELALELTLTPTRKLAQADAAEVMRALVERGYYLQLPPGDPAARA